MKTAQRTEFASLIQSLNLDSYPELMRVNDVAAVMGVCPQTVYHLIQTGDIVALEVGRGGKRVFRLSLAEYLERQVL